MRGCDRVVTAEVPIVPPTDAIVATKATELECMKDHVFTVSADLVPSKYLPDDKGIAANDNQVLSIRFTALTKTIVLILIFASFIFLLCSSILETMTYKILGLLSLLITEDPTSQFSLISIAQYFPQTTGDSSNSAGLFVTALFILYSVVIPLMSVIGIAALWLIPMKSSFQRNLYIFTEACFAFSQFDVAVLTLIVNTQTDSFAAFLALVIGNYCDGINVILAEYLDTALDGNDQCFTISTHLSKNSWTILVALVCYLSLVLLALICFGIACEERHVLTSTSAETQNQVQPVSSMKASTKAKLNSKDLNEPLLIRNNDELILNSESYPPTQTLSTWRKVKSTFLGSCLILSIVEISESSSKVVRHSMDGREIDPTFN